MSHKIKDLLDSYDSYDQQDGKKDRQESEDLVREYRADEEPVIGVSYHDYSTLVKVELDSRLTQSLIISFEQLVIVTKRDNKLDGAILLDLPLASGDVVGCWIPKKLCSNLDLELKTICVWDKFMVDKIEELGGLSYEPEYAG